LEVVPVDNIGRARATIWRPDHWDWIIFVSANAVRYALSTGWVDRPPRLSARIAAVGEATASALACAGVQVDLIPKPQFNSESLLAAAEFQTVASKRILIVRGVGGREHLAESLSARGAITAYAELYRRVSTGHGLEGLRDACCANRIDWVVVTSGEVLAALTDFLGYRAADWLAETTLVAMSDRIANLARQAGWKNIEVADSASDRGIVAALERLAQTAKPRAVGDSYRFGPGFNEMNH
jgi:uroporphyrinogen-III synthase